MWRLSRAPKCSPVTEQQPRTLGRVQTRPRVARLRPTPDRERFPAFYLHACAVHMGLVWKECHNNHLYICSLDIVISVVMNTPAPLHFYGIFSPLKGKQMAFILKLWSSVTCCTLQVYSSFLLPAYAVCTWLICPVACCTSFFFNCNLLAGLFFKDYYFIILCCCC